MGDLTLALSKNSIRVNQVGRRISENKTALVSILINYIGIYRRLILDKKNITLVAKWFPEGLICFVLGLKYSVFVHGSEVIPSRRYLGLRNVLMNMVLSKASYIIANSDFTSNLVSQHKQTIVIPLAVNFSRFKNVQEEIKTQKDDGYLRIATVSRLEEHKGHIFVLKAILRLDPELRNKIRYNIIGDGSHRYVIEKFITENKLGDIVNLVGRVDESTLLKYLRRTDIFILCSKYLQKKRKVEGFGISVIEAQAIGIPVIISNEGGLPETLKYSKGGFIINGRNSIELARLIEDLSLDADRRKAIGSNGIEAVKNFYNWERYVSELLDLLSNDS